MISSNDKDGKNERKPRFSARKSVVTENRLRELETFGGSQIPHSDYYIILEDMILMAIRRHGRPYPMLKLQCEILTELIECENTVSHYKNKLEELTKKNASEEEIKYVKAEMSKYRRLRYALRDIGDGIAWRLLGFDRFVLQNLAIRARKQHINKEGLASELHELADVINKHDKPAVLNDITHFLKKGDITAKTDDNSFEFIEVKSSKSKGSRLIRQMKNLDETVSFLNEGEKENNGEILKISNLNVDPESYMSNFEKILLRAERQCVVTQKIGEHLVLHVIDFSSAKEEIDPTPLYKKRDEILKSWTESEDLVLEFSSIDRYAHVQNFAPFSIFPIQHRFRAKLMTGTVFVHTSLNISFILRYLTKRGWAIIKAPEDFKEVSEENEVYLAAIKKGSLTIQLPMPIVGRLGHEFLSLKTLGDTLDEILKMGPSSAAALFPNFIGEFKQWN